MDMTQYNQLIARIGKASGKLREDIQQALLACAIYALKDGNADPASRLLAAVGNGTRRAGITRWLHLNTCISATVSKGEAKVRINKTRRADFATMSEDEYLNGCEGWEGIANAAAWYDTVPPETTPAWDEQRIIDGILKTLDKRMIEAQDRGRSAMAELLRDAQTLILSRITATAE